MVGRLPLFWAGSELAYEDVWCLTNVADRRVRIEERCEECGDGEDGWSSNDELGDGPVQEGWWQHPDPMGDLSMSELRERDEEDMWLRMRGFPRRRGVRGQVPREMLVVVEMSQVGHVRAHAVARQCSNETWDAMHEAWAVACKWAVSVEEEVGITQRVKQHMTREERVKWAEGRAPVDVGVLKTVKGEVSVVARGLLRQRKDKRKTERRETMAQRLKRMVREMNNTGQMCGM